MTLNQMQCLNVNGDALKGASPSASEAAQSFVIRSPAHTLRASGVAAYLPAGTVDTLGERVRKFFADRRLSETKDGNDAPAILTGALPFDRQHKDFLIQPRCISQTLALPGTDVQPALRNWKVTAEPSAEQYSAMVARALLYMQTPIAREAGLDKVVLARRLKLQSNLPIDPDFLAARLARDPAATAFVVPLPEQSGVSRFLVGGTPELLVARQGMTVRSNPLAGSARRQADSTLDQAAAQALKNSDKDQREHAMVVEAILDNLAPYCEQLKTPRLAELQSTASMWHLGSVIEGRLRDADVSSAELAARLHPTPAVAGSPRDHAQALIRELEPFDRGFYAGAVGWTDSSGDGEWYVSLRCGEISDRQILLYAGAGIVVGSDPEAEAAETSAKFMALLSALGVDERGRQLPGDGW